jgi:hypothetical protein
VNIPKSKPIVSADYPEISGELRLIIEDQWGQATPAFRSRAKRVLKQMG